MEIVVRPARPQDPCVPLLYASSQPYYDAYAGTQARALALLRAVFPRPGHAASYELCYVAEAEGELARGLAGFPGPAGGRPAPRRCPPGPRWPRRFIALALPRLPPWRWPGTLRHLRAAGTLSPHPPAPAYYVDARAVDPAWRPRGGARRGRARRAARVAGGGRARGRPRGPARRGAGHRADERSGARPVQRLRVRR